jgi:hypothetical protein
MKPNPPKILALLTLSVAMTLSGCKESIVSSQLTNESYITLHGLSESVSKYMDGKIEKSYSGGDPDSLAFHFCVYRELGADEQGESINIYIYAFCGGRFSKSVNFTFFESVNPVALHLKKQGKEYKFISSTDYLSEVYKYPGDSDYDKIFPKPIRKKISEFDGRATGVVAEYHAKWKELDQTPKRFESYMNRT